LATEETLRILFCSGGGAGGLEKDFERVLATSPNSSIFKSP